MKTNIRYRVASNPGDWVAAHKLLREVGEPKDKLTFPTILAWEGMDLVGVCGTRIKDGAIVAGPMAIKPDRRRTMTAFRLAEAYVSAMQTLGIQSFVLSVQKDSFLHKGIQKLYPHLAPFDEDEEGTLFYVWRPEELIDGQQN